MAEWLKAHAWKACVRETVPWVRIPLSPPRTFGLEVSGDLFRDPVECRAQIALCFCICALHANEIPRTDRLVQFDYVRVVDLDIGVSKSDNLRDQSAHYFRARACRAQSYDLGLRERPWKRLCAIGNALDVHGAFESKVPHPVKTKPSKYMAT